MRPAGLHARLWAYAGWPVFDGGYASYPRFKKEWRAYRETYHSAVNNDLAARALRDKCIKGDALRMISHLDDLREIWETLDTCYERPEKYMEEALRPIVDLGGTTLPTTRRLGNFTRC